MTLLFKRMVGRLRASLFVLPMICITGAVIGGEAMIALDRRLGKGIGDLPLGFTSTVESARAVVSTIAGATITVAGIAFSIAILIFQLASSQYSPRVIHGMFRDPFNKRVMGLVAGTFTYCLIVLRSIRSAVDKDGEAVIPNASVALAVLLGVVALIAIVAFINHSAHSMDVGRILGDITTDTLKRIRANWPEPGQVRDAPSRVDPESPSMEIRSTNGGWIDLIDETALLESLPRAGRMRLEVARGDFIVEGQVLAHVWPAGAEVNEKRIRRAIHVGEGRSTEQDPLYGVRQLVDVALKALSPSVNDPTTAQAAMFHMAAVLAELCRRDAPPPSHVGEDGRYLLMTDRPHHDDVFALAFDELRLAAGPQPHAARHLLEAIGLVARSGAAVAYAPLLATHADLVLGTAERAGATGRDLALLRAEHQSTLQALTAPSPGG